jgi:hypothetical protein
LPFVEEVLLQTPAAQFRVAQSASVAQVSPTGHCCSLDAPHPDAPPSLAPPSERPPSSPEAPGVAVSDEQAPTREPTKSADASEAGTARKMRFIPSRIGDSAAPRT